MATEMVSQKAFDTSALEKGSTISVDEVERIIGAERHTVEYGLKALGLTQQIDRDMYARGIVVVVRMDKGAIVVCTDPEASGYTEHRMATLFKHMGRMLAKHQAVDVGNLTLAKRHSHDRNGEVWSQMYAAAGSVADAPRVLAAAYERKTPGLIE